ncbi:MAG: VWA domain-containing protein [Myxococcales bacterium]|nr:VWA domain-containing protein [Myxococcales bacterium]MBK7197165.1 VWA domain-containing protein [Myxococcales bacterium]MBP6846800.1 VWA domain-containing protein [Kofleriaceae bacterium]
MRHRPWPLIALGAAALHGRAAADVVRSDERGAELSIAQPRITAELGDGVAYLRVRYDVVNASRIPDRARVQLELPTGAVVVGLRQRTGGAWIAGRLEAAEAVEARMAAYVDAPFVAARGAVALTGAGAFHDLTLTYVPPRGQVGVEYEVVVPACYAHGEWVAVVPRLEVDPTLTVARGRVDDAADVAKRWGEPVVDACEHLVAYDTADPADHVLAWPARAATGLRLTDARLAVPGLAVRDVELAIAPRLVAPPVRPTVVFVVDASKSQGADGVAAQLAIVRGYLAHQPDARVEVVVARRAATRLFGDVVPASTFPAALAARAAALTVGNGSHLERGLALAADILAAASGPRRLVAFTDDRLRPALTDDALRVALARLPADAIAHVVVPHGGAAEVWTDRESHFAGVIAPWGGIAATVGAAGDPAPLVELVRPIALRDVAVGDEVIADEVREGHGLRSLTQTDAAAPVTAWLWGRRVEATVLAAPVDRIRVARLTLARFEELDDAAVQALAGLAHATTRLTSLIADQPSWQPGGLPEVELGMRGGDSGGAMCGLPMGISGVGRIGTIGHGSGTVTVDVLPRPDVHALLAARIDGCAAPLGARGWQLAIEVATTGDEVVDVAAALTGVDDAGLAARVEACAIEAGWDLDLDASFARYTTTFATTFGP